MARKKYKTKAAKKGFIKEITGILLIVISLLGIFTNQLVGNFIKGMAIFLVGNVYFILLGLIFVLGLYIIIKRDTPKCFNSKFLGIYLLIIAILTICNFNSAELIGTSVFEPAMTQLSDVISFNEINVSINTGGGVLGATFTYIFKMIGGLLGLYIITFALLLVGIILTFNVSLRDVILSVINFFKQTISDIKESFSSNDEEEPITEEIEKKRISSVDELIKINDGSVPKETIKPKQNAVKNINGYTLPSLDILDETKILTNKENSEDVKNNVVVLEKVLKDFEIEAKVVEIHIGPTVTQYEMELKAGTKVNKVLGIHREIALALAAKDIRIQAPIPGKNTIGIELPNRITAPVGLREMLESIPESDNRKLLTVLGKNIMGRPISAEISSMPHLLVAGATGSGKSVCINGIIVSILMRATPEEVKLVLVDPKKVELSSYEGIPHLLAPVVTNPKKASGVLQKIVSEMENRYEIFNASKTKNIASYNEYIDKKNKGLATDQQEKRLPYIVVIIDELADLMLVAQKEVEDSIMRITQMARAAGIHLIVATQRPSTDVITGLIKANIPSRLAFEVSSSIDSRTILDMMGAEKLLGKGDMLFLPMGENAPQRIQGAYVSEEEIKRVVKFVSEQQKVEYDENLNVPEEGLTSKDLSNKTEGEDELYPEVVEFVVRTGKASTSLLQRKFSIGFNRAAKIIDQLEESSIIGPQNGSKPREVLVTLDDE